MHVNVIGVPADEDFARVKALADQHAGWSLRCRKKLCRVWTKPAPDSEFLMIKSQCEFVDVPAATLYDVLHDADYRSLWDKYMLDSVDLGLVNPNNEICYYAIRSPSPLKHRDFVLQRSWLDLGHEMYILAHSVCHSDYPPRRGRIRGVCYLTAYYIRPTGPSSCTLTYFTHSDPKGHLPGWLMNKLTHHVMPRTVKTLRKACISYDDWKQQHCKDWKPWTYAHQCELRRVDLSKCTPVDYQQEVEDESAVPAAAVPNVDASDNDED